MFEGQHWYVANDLNILNMAAMCGKRLKYLRNGFPMLEMTLEFEKRFIYVGNGFSIRESAKICGK